MLRAFITAAACAAVMVSAEAQDGPYAGDPALTMDQAIVLRSRLADDVLVLSRAVELQSLLLAWNGIRAQDGMALATLPREICLAPALAPHCAALPATFGPAP